MFRGFRRFVSWASTHDKGDEGMRTVKYLLLAATTTAALLGIAGGAQAANYALKVNAEGPVLEKGTPAAYTISISEPAEVNECVYTGPKGEIEVNNAPVVELGFNSAYTEANKLCGGVSKKVGFTRVYVQHFFGVTLVFESFKPFAKIRLGATCIYNVATMYGTLVPPALTEVALTGHITLKEGALSCAKEREITGSGKISDPGNNEEPFYLVEE
jgi:hypothetical protein